jgi:hypothetical protein
MQSGRFDVYFALETNIRPFFRLLGTPDRDKDLRVYPTGHSVWLLNEYRKDMLDFLDKHLGPVSREPADLPERKARRTAPSPAPSPLSALPPGPERIGHKAQ